MKTMLLILLLCAGLSAQASEPDRPNVVIILTDDQGYNDLGCYGSEKIKTPRIDQMASEGIRLTSFYQAAPLCGPSRAALLTGCYSQRVAEPENKKEMHTKLDGSEILIPELLKPLGYTTACFGKWHIAGSGKSCLRVDSGKNGLAKYSVIDPELMPLQQGFDVYFGIPYSNDMKPAVLMRGNEFVEEIGNGTQQTGITTRYTDEALDFIEQNKEGPFCLYLAHNMPHTPLWPSKQFEGKSEYGRYGDCIEEIDWNTGRILNRLKELGIDENTFVVFTSDNGPWIRADKQMTKDSKKVPSLAHLQGGCADPLRGYKLTTHDGGMRVPCVIRYPKKIPAGRVSDELVSGIDVFPTIARLAGANLPNDRRIDGLDLSEFLFGKIDKSPRKEFYFYKWLHLHAIRSGDWKLVLPREAHPADLKWYNRYQEEVKDITLFDLKQDIGETTNLAEQHPEVVSRINKLVEQAQADLGDRSRGIDGSGVRKLK